MLAPQPGSMYHGKQFEESDTLLAIDERIAQDKARARPRPTTYPTLAPPPRGIATQHPRAGARRSGD